MLINLSLLFIVIYHFENCRTFASLSKSSHENLKNSLLWTIHLDPYHGLLSGPQRVNESMYDQEVHLQLDICSCSKNHNEIGYWTFEPQTSDSFKPMNEKNLKCSFFCNGKKKQFKSEEINNPSDNTKRKADGKYKVMLISFIVDDFNEESLDVYEKIMISSFNCIKTGRCQDVANKNLKSKKGQSDHHLEKRFARRLINRIKKKKPGKKGKHGRKDQTRSEAVNAPSTSPPNMRSGKHKKNASTTYSNATQFNIPSDANIRDLQLHPKVCFMIVCPEQQTIKNAGILDAYKRPAQKKPISKAPSFRSASEDYGLHENQKDKQLTEKEISTTVKPTTRNDSSTTKIEVINKVTVQSTKKKSTEIMPMQHKEATTPTSTEEKTLSSNVTTQDYADYFEDSTVKQ